MNVDEEDQCTFWYTNEYIPAGGQWRTRIARFHYPNCGPAVDRDGDLIPDCLDNCPDIPNMNQFDTDQDGTGDACDECPDGQAEFDSFLVSDPCGDPSDGVIQANETLFLDVTVTNPTGMDTSFLMGTLSTPNGVEVIRDRAVFEPLPTPPSGTATARFVVAVELPPAQPCPPWDPRGLLFVVDPSGPMGCASRMTFWVPFTDCSPGGGLEPVPGEVPSSGPNHLKVTKSPPDTVHADWGAVAGAANYNLYRGTFPDLVATASYNHIVSPAGAGWCAVPDLFRDDPNDLITPGNFYYLVTAGAACGLEGPIGFDSEGRERAAGGGCP